MIRRGLAVVGLAAAFPWACGDEVPTVDVDACRSSCNKIQTCRPDRPASALELCLADCNQLEGLEAGDAEACVSAFNAFNRCIIDNPCDQIATACADDEAATQQACGG